MRLRYALRGHLGQIVLSNPPQNTLTTPAFADPRELADFLAQRELRAVVVQGEGKHFSAGADVGALRAAVAGELDRLKAELAQGQALLETLSAAPVPVLALVRGSCLGAGLEIALACHFRLCTPNALLGFPETDHGLLPGMGGILAALGVLPRARALELVLTGRLVRGEEAARLGLVDRCAPVGRLEAEGEAFLYELVGQRPPHLVRAVLEAVHRAGHLPHEEALRAETEAFCRLAAMPGGPRGEAP